ncbi:methionyl-tRNA synthetase [Sodiomyces alkalinus F11]|uniref:Probable methionine--tRNA ligase, mitochondrial n=1 Tax=Sodiomyces alkalinus (strain CBS 110278 / VKM F-3762 / F11) TaxID=1314773 RepID=A0A3N2Q8Z1_SODAK|nr:methionyl-tRNA synthetase [Sodiomyces alkalinus F11]ROT43234.1 methionyl-tRNA synthetase [Sodiomyces alkalinus F11]
MGPPDHFLRALRSSAARGWSGSRPISYIRPRWVCPSCSHGQSKRWSTTTSSGTSSSPAKPFYVTTPIFYVNASPHVGHMYSMVLADAIKRWHVLRGRKALLCTGTDEHGMKVQRAAAQQGIPSKEFCDSNAQKFRELAALCGMDNDFFVRTTDQDHIYAVQHFWFMLKENGYIYESKHSGWYCVSDECFYSETEIEKTAVPQTGKTIMASIASGNEVEWIEEKNYHFRMTALRDQLLRFYEENPDWIVPRAKMNEVVHWVKNNLEDLSISRPVSRLDWGIRVPDDPSQTIYVWVDALINYLTKAGFPAWAPGQEQRGGWPADVHVIGKDILRFHGVYWPALLMAVGIQPPKQLLSHAHWTLGKRKMSKSLGNVVNPFFAIERWGVDTMRYFMLRDGGIENDADYENSLVFARYEKDLRSMLGNTLSRITRSARWDVAEAVAWARAHEHKTGSRYREKGWAKLAEQVDATPRAMAAAMEEGGPNPGVAIRAAMELLAEANRYFASREPWDATKVPDAESRNKIVFHAAEAVRVAGILMQPFMPTKMAQLLDILGVQPDRRTFDHAVFRGDLDYGVRKEGGKLPKGKWAALFPPVVPEELDSA